MIDINTDSISGGVVQNLEFARPWPRFWARRVDSILETYIFAAVVGVILGVAGFFPDESKLYTYLIAFFCVCGAFFLDAIIFCILGNTLGKKIVGLNVVHIDRRNLSFVDILRRNIGVLVAGYGLGLPIVSLFTMMSALSTVERGNQTMWDTKNGTQVIQDDVASWRLWIAVAIVVAGSSVGALTMIAGR